MPKGDKYIGLTTCLEQSGIDEAELSFEQIANLVGGLPRGAYKNRFAWYNGCDHSLAHGWKNAGYSVTAKFEEQRVVFRKEK